jgi:cyclin H
LIIASRISALSHRRVPIAHLSYFEVMIEDDAYRSSTQYRYWSFTKQKLAETRHSTNALAAAKVKAAFQRSHSLQNSSLETTTNQIPDLEIQTLSVDEELKIIEWGSSKIMQMGEAMDPRIPSHIVVGEDRFETSLFTNI